MFSEEDLPQSERRLTKSYEMRQEYFHANYEKNLSARNALQNRVWAEGFPSCPLVLYMAGKSGSTQKSAAKRRALAINFP